MIDLRSQLLARLPDEPRWVEARGMLRAGGCAVVALDERGESALIRSSRYRLLALVGTPEAGALARAMHGLGGSMVLVQEDAAPVARTALVDWTAERATLFTLPLAVQARWPRGGPDVRLLGPHEGDLLDHLPGGLRTELGAALVRAPIAAAFAGDRPVSFSYAWMTTETLFDVSVDTLDAYRNRGLGRETARFLIRHYTAIGLRPVWGASETNPASARLARRLGFEPAQAIWVFTPPAPA